MVKDTKQIRKLKHNSRRLSIKEGIFCSVKGSFGDQYVSPFAMAVNASNSVISLITTVTGILGPLSQIFGSKRIEKNSRKKILLKTIFFESLTWLPLIIIAFLFYKGIIVNTLPLLILIIIGIYTVILNFGHPAWFSWLGDIVDDNYRGRWFSKRNLIIGFISVIAAIIASVFLDFFKNKGWIMFGFMILFFLAFIARLFCWKIIKTQYEPKIKLKQGYYFSFWSFVKNMPKNNFGRFTIFRSLLAFSTAIVSPLIAVYLLRYIGFDYKEYIIITVGGTFVSLFVLELWGKFADRYGNYKALVIASILIPIEAILWILNASLIYLLLIPSIINGIAWAGISLTTGNIIYDNISKQKRGLAVSYFNMVWGIGVASGATIGAILIKFLDTKFLPPLLVIFIISAIARAIVIIWWVPKIKEIRETKKCSMHKALRYLLFKKTKHTLIEETHAIVSIKKYLETKPCTQKYLK